MPAVGQLHVAPVVAPFGHRACERHGDQPVAPAVQHERGRADGNGGWSVVEGLAHDDFAREKLRVTTEELEGERDEVRSLGLI